MNTKRLVHTGLLLALDLVLSRFLSVSTPIVKLSFGFIPIAVIAILYGPIYSGAAGAISDFIGAILFPIGPFFFGFTLSALLRGVIFGVFLHKRPRNITRIILAVGTITLFVSLGLGTLWISILMGKAFWVLLPTRLVQALIMVPVQIIGIYNTGKLLYQNTELGAI